MYIMHNNEEWTWYESIDKSKWSKVITTITTERVAIHSNIDIKVMLYAKLRIVACPVSYKNDPYFTETQSIHTIFVFKKKFHFSTYFFAFHYLFSKVKTKMFNALGFRNIEYQSLSAIDFFWAAWQLHLLLLIPLWIVPD